MKTDLETLRSQIDKSSTHSAEEKRFLNIMDAWDAGAIPDWEAAQRFEFLCRDLFAAIRDAKP